MSFEESFGETIRKLRMARKLSLREVADAIGIDTSLLAKIEKNSRKPTMLFIEKFSDYFDISGKDLKIIFLSDTIAYKILDEEEDCADEILSVAERKVNYLKSKKEFQDHEVSY